MTERLLNATKWAAGFEERDAHVVVRLTPALRSEEFFETFCGLAQAGKLNEKGMPRNPLQLVVWTTSTVVRSGRRHLSYGSPFCPSSLRLRPSGG